MITDHFILRQHFDYFFMSSPYVFPPMSLDMGLRLLYPVGQIKYQLRVQVLGAFHRN